MQSCIQENLPMTLSTSSLSYDSSSGLISPYTLCDPTLQNLQHTPHSQFSNSTSFSDISLCFSLQMCLSLLPLFPSLPALFAESQNHLFRYNTQLFSFLSCNLSEIIRIGIKRKSQSQSEKMGQMFCSEEGAMKRQASQVLKQAKKGNKQFSFFFSNESFIAFQEKKKE